MVAKVVERGGGKGRMRSKLLTYLFFYARPVYLVQV